MSEEKKDYEEMCIGDVYVAEIVGKGGKGDPLVTINGFVVFVQEIPEGVELCVGTKVQVGVTKLLQKFGFAKLLEVIK